MNKIILLNCLLICLSGCNYEKSKIPAGPATESKNSTQNKVDDKLKGLWTDGSIDGASIDIKEKEIFYVDQGTDYHYHLQKDTIVIQFPDYTYKAKVSFLRDTLIMSSVEYGESKFWKFKH